MKPLLGVNIDHVATLRQARKVDYPSVLEAAKIVAAAGADSITVHLREDRRHIQSDDVLAIKKNLTLPLNLEMAVTEDMLAFACDVRPTYVCLVPEKREELTTEGGLDVARHVQRISFTVKKLQEAGILVSLFIDPEEAQIKAAKNTGATIIELHTGDYANAMTPDAVVYELSRLQKAAQQAHQLGLQVNAGHGLHYTNTQAILALPHICELNIGHAIIARALFVGLAEAVREMKALFVDR